MLSCPNSCGLFTPSITRTHQHRPFKNLPLLSLFQSPHPRFSLPPKSSLNPTPPLLAASDGGEENGKERPKLRWVEIGPNITEAQKEAISQLPPKMTKRCKAIMKRIICFSPEEGGELSLLLSTWVKLMKPRRADWLSVLKEMKSQENPLFLQVIEFALEEESFEANIRDYTKIIHEYGKQNCLREAENTFMAMKKRGFTCDQVTLTVLIHMYSKASNLSQAEETFEELKLLGLPLDKKAYGSMIMAYIRAGMAERGESLMREMETQDVYPGREVYKALLRAYSMSGDAEAAQRVFGAIQFAGIVPDAKLCALLMNAYCVAGQTDKARSVMENLRKARIELSDKCVALMLAAYEKENNLNKALGLVMDLENDGGYVVGKEAAEVLAKWFRRLGVVDEVEHVLRAYYTQTNKLQSIFL
ncbi:hypothetical protein MRB53_019824 [Persea americana]|uniref:Uncharacterized protein n=1 Tax=Persea americana TaxID=3435 RepID=A0ACC2KZ72_PERAE|nr:hypothetical protein MRB53_019824 [Persea americana]|eukprot:TRINITY_DN37061_c1_g1_i1.p1 TRINITY_DN37061_c1_g1~~TRINITY_DN37061_c1_g1_i1.p1  ORF type:complete len:417 (+),score=88.05 TRINITY_DN37061_c1_g1_i1:134-1384(+)